MINNETKKRQPTETGVGEDGEKLEPSHTAGGNAKWCSYFGKQSGSSSKC